MPVLVIFGIVGAIVVGWVGNLVQTIMYLSALDKFVDISGYGILQIVGIFAAPVGSVLGWVGFF